MAQCIVNTGKHARKYCPMYLPMPPGVGQTCSVRLGDRLVAGQELQGNNAPCLCVILPEAAAGEAIPVTMEGQPAPDDGGVLIRERQPGVLAVEVDGEPFTAYHFGEEGNRPFLHPVIGPYGKQVTRTFPMVANLPGESQDHPHHRSIWTAHGDVNGQNDWAEGPQEARILHRAFAAVESGPVFGSILEELDWVAADDRLLLREEREIRVYRTPTEHRIMDWNITLRATAGPVRLGDTKEGGMLSVRVASAMDADRGGIIENAWGGIGEAECWGKPAPWCDYSGVVEGEHVGIAVFDWRENPGYPTTWHVRDYGLMTANIFGQRAFHGDNPLFSGDLVLQAGATLTFNYRLFLHAGGARQAEVAGRYLDYVYPPVVQPHA